jgi:ribonuclease BN (tRNA processing enzyme)
MKKLDLLFLGTCAADFSPKLKTDFKDCFDKDARRASCALLDGHILIDAGPHLLDSMRIAGIGSEAITDVFITHLHSDHFSPENIAEIASQKSEALRLYVRYDAEIPEIPNTEVIKMNNFDGCKTGEFTVTGLPANHDKSACPRWLLFEKGDKKLLYATDGGWICNDTYYYLRNSGLDLLIMDCTCGEAEGEYRIGEHNTIPMIRLMLPSFKTFGLINESTSVILTHLAPSLHKPHDEIQKLFEKDSITVAFDGMKIKL